MEQILSLLKQLMAQGGMLGSIPKPIKITLLYFGVGVGIFVVWRTIKDPSTKVFLIVALVVLAVITGAYYGWKAWKEKQQNENIRNDISQHSPGSPRTISHPGQTARLD